MLLLKDIIKDSTPSLDDNFDAIDHALVVYNPKTDQIGWCWPKSWFGTLIFLDYYEKETKLSELPVVYDDMPEILDFVVIAPYN